jgi:hypothetical protein
MTTTIDDLEVAPPDIDMSKVEAFGVQMMSILNLGMTANMMSIGHQVGLFDTMAEIGHLATSEEIAEAAGLDERYVREWLGAMTTSSVVEYDSGKGSYLLPPEHAALTTRAAGPNNFASYTQFVPMCGAIEPELIEAFRNGGGVPYSSFPRFHAAMREISAATFDATLVDVTLPLVPGAVERLRSGIQVADVGTGSGHAINVLANAFPESTFVGSTSPRRRWRWAAPRPRNGDCRTPSSACTTRRTSPTSATSTSSRPSTPCTTRSTRSPWWRASLTW